MNPDEKIRSCFHSKDIVRIGQYTLFAGSIFNMRLTDLSDIDIVVSLTETVPAKIWQKGYKNFIIWSFPIRDYYGPEGPWKIFIEKVIYELARGKKYSRFAMAAMDEPELFLPL